MGDVPRRVVTGHTADGVSVVLSDGPVPVSRQLPEDGVAFHEIWNTEGAPARIVAAEDTDPTERALAVPPPTRGTKIRINEFAPGFLDEAGLQSPVHRTESVDYGIVLEGEITLVLDDSEVTLGAGDVVVQRGTDHAWANRGTTTAKVAFILVDGEFDPALVATLPDGAVAGLMHGAPREEATMQTAKGSMATDRPERYAKQLASHWAKRGPATEEDGATVLRWETGQVIVLRPVQGALEVEVSVPDDGDVDRFAQVVKEHLERFGQRDELNVVWG